MMNHIDVSSVLRQTLSCDLYSNLITRPTGAAVRGQIEQLLEHARGGDVELTVIDFSHVAMIDFSCADEVVAKLLLRYATDDAPRDAYFVFRGVNDDHWDAIETVLERHGLALVLEADDGPRLVGVISDDERRTWETLNRLGLADADTTAEELAADPADVRHALELLWRRRLVRNVGGRYVAVGGGIPRDR
jgi:hypothetical protein